MQTTSTAFERVLDKLINEEIDKATGDIANGQLPDFGEYRFQAGKVAGMRQVLGYFDEVNRIINES